MNKKLLCTLGPSSLNEFTIKRLSDIGVSLFRINLSHTPIEKLESMIRLIQLHTKVPICLDSEGAQVRTSAMQGNESYYAEGSIVNLAYGQAISDSATINLWPESISSQITPGDLISIDFNAVLAQVISLNKLKIINAGVVGSNKAVTILKNIILPALSEKDKAAFKMGLAFGIKHFALSFANRGEDVLETRAIIGSNGYLISKIECVNGYQNLDQILEHSDCLLIDRGDLSREYPIEKIPFLQKDIIERAKKANKEVVVATNLLESMVSTSLPTRAEVNDVITVINSGADGLVLAAETAIGRFPMKAAEMIVKLVEQNEIFVSHPELVLNPDKVDLLPKPHGHSGRLINLVGPLDTVDEKKQINLTDEEVLDCEQIAVGTFSPLKGFLDKEDLTSVLSKNQLADGTVWTMPILLQRNKSDFAHFRKGDLVNLVFRGSLFGTIEVSEIYQFDIDTLVNKWFLTNDKKHPGVAKISSRGEFFLAGNIRIKEQIFFNDFAENLFTPEQYRQIFNTKGWTRVVGFHTRNVVHRAHEFIQISALENYYADGLLISPVIGPKKSGDFKTEVILRAYSILIEKNIYPKEKVFLGSFPSYSRFCGPREAVFTALCRKNMGCSHFIIGRDHAGVGDFYTSKMTNDIFYSIHDLGIMPVFFENVFYNRKINKIVSSSVEEKSEEKLVPISGSIIRETLNKGGELPEWMIRPQVLNYLKEEINRGVFVFEK
jgi:pyruvate kinase